MELDLFGVGEPWLPQVASRVCAVWEAAQTQRSTSDWIRLDTGGQFWLQAHACFPELQTCQTVSVGRLELVAATVGGQPMVKVTNPHDSIWLQQFEANSSGAVAARWKSYRTAQKVVASIRFECDGRSCSKYVLFGTLACMLRDLFLAAKGSSFPKVIELHLRCVVNTIAELSFTSCFLCCVASVARVTFMLRSCTLSLECCVKAHDLSRWVCRLLGVHDQQAAPCAAGLERNPAILAWNTRAGSAGEQTFFSRGDKALLSSMMSAAFITARCEVSLSTSAPPPTFTAPMAHAANEAHEDPMSSVLSSLHCVLLTVAAPLQSLRSTICQLPATSLLHGEATNVMALLDVALQRGSEVLGRFQDSALLPPLPPLGTLCFSVVQQFFGRAS